MDDGLEKNIRMFIMNRRLIANPQEKGAPIAMQAKDNERQFVEKEMQTNINANKHVTQRYQGSAI